MNGIAIAILLLTFVFLLVIKCPITFSMVISTSLAMLYLDIPVMTMVQQMCKQLNSFTLLAIPFFILMGELMAQGGISSRLLKFADCASAVLRAVWRMSTCWPRCSSAAFPVPPLRTSPRWASLKSR